MEKQRGWPADCQQCEVGRNKEGVCRAENAEGLCPCQVMSHKLFKYLCKQAEED